MLPPGSKLELSSERSIRFEAMLKRGIAKQLHNDGLLSDEQLTRLIIKINSHIAGSSENTAL